MDENIDGILNTLKFNDSGLIPCITTSARDNQVLMMAWMNLDALRRTIETHEMHYWSRSRGELWHKGKTSGHVQKLISLKVDCDRDCLLAAVEVESDEEIACHTGVRSCFFEDIV